MTTVSDDPALWPVIRSAHLVSYFVVSASTAVIYSWALTFGQEFELILRQRWSFMTVLYICVRYIGILFSVMNILSSLLVSIADMVGTIIWFIQVWVPAIVNTMLGVIMIARINAMHQGSKKLRTFLVTALLACTIASGVMLIIGSLGVSRQEAVLSGYYICVTEIGTSMRYLNYESLIPTIIWEILTLFLTAWTVIKHIRELRQSCGGSTIGNCFMIMIKDDMLYFLAFSIMACFMLSSLSSITNSSPMESAIFSGMFSIVQVLEMFVLGSRLILRIREYHAQLMTRADGETCMTSIAFLAGGDELNSGGAQTGEDV